MPIWRGGRWETHHGEEQRVYSHNGPKVATQLLVSDALVDGRDCSVAVAVETSPQGLDELVRSRVFGQLYDAVAQDDRHQGMDDGGRDTFCHDQGYYIGTGAELILDQIGKDVTVD